MKKTLFLMTAALFSLQSANAQKALMESTTCDNWFVGINAGVGMKTTHNDDRLKNLNPSVGVRLGRNWTPVAGWMLAGDAYLRDKAFDWSSAKRLKGVSLDALGTLNLSNWFGGYLGQPRAFEVVAIGGLGWNHIFDTKLSRANDLVSKVGLDLTFNIGSRRAWQFYVEPAINYNLTQTNEVRYNINRSGLQLSAGINYKFGNSNGTHNFALAELRSQEEIDALNDRINALQAESAAKTKSISEAANKIATLEEDLAAARKVKPDVVVTNVTKVVNNNVLQPTVIFGQGKSSVDAAQMASVAMIAKYMKNHPESQILIKGYASPEGKPELNQKLSEARAEAVKKVLVSRYGVAASRLTTQGMGATDELFDEIDFNRVATFTDTSK